MKGFFEFASEELDRLFRFVRSRVASEEETRDIMQDVFLAFTARWNLGDRIEDSLAWLFRTARNKIVDHYRRRRRREISLEGLEEGLGEGLREVFVLAERRASRPEEEAEREEVRMILLEAIGDLPEEQKEVLVLTEMDGMTFREISESTCVPLNTLLARKRYAVQKLRRVLSERLKEMVEE